MRHCCDRPLTIAGRSKIMDNDDYPGTLRNTMWDNVLLVVRVRRCLVSGLAGSPFTRSRCRLMCDTGWHCNFASPAHSGWQAGVGRASR